MKLLDKIVSHIQHYDSNKYWKMREYIQNRQESGKHKYYTLGGIKELICIFRCKRMDAFAGASTGLRFGSGSAHFDSKPRLPHNLYGIIIAPYVKIGKNCRICQQVTIGNDYKDIHNAPIIGDNVEIYPGAKIVGKITIGNNVKIGANAVVFQDVPDNATVVVDSPRIIVH